LQQYAVPADRTNAVVGTLNGVLLGNQSQPGIGRASSRVDGQVVVLAPARMQASIGKTIASLASAEAQPSSTGSVRVEYWLVDALPGAGESEGMLAPVQPALDAARPALGEVRFRLVESVSLLSATSRNASAETLARTVNIRHQLTPAQGGVFASIHIDPNAHNPDISRIELRVSAELPFGQTLLLAQQDAPGNDGVRRLVLVRAQPASAP
jgi:hypothetical protein